MSGVGRKQRAAIVLACLGFGLAQASRAASATPVSAGADVFDAECSDCHSVSAKMINRKGPTLYHVIGRKPGSVPGFKYSADMKALGAPWSPQSLEAYLTNPKAVVPGGVMKFKGLPGAQDRQNVIAFLASLN